MAADPAAPNFSTKKTEHVKVRATYAYYSENSYELSFETNDVIDVINKFEDDQSYDGWWSGKLHGRVNSSGEQSIFFFIPSADWPFPSCVHGGDPCSQSAEGCGEQSHLFH